MEELGVTQASQNIISKSELVSAEPSTVLVKEGGITDRIYLITKGHCRIVCKELQKRLKRENRESSPVSPVIHS